ncbi:CCAAT/enhancer-binding protein zeta [Phyllosticta citrichinensis]|uniref:CCAAT/enhancer-binding protein zeta n=1 Tax=Phyllosticta citrichinensis TaxID=1130410 RepID=A0ABR1XVB4_9PEZI
MGKKRTASESRNGAEKPFRKNDKPDHVHKGHRDAHKGQRDAKGPKPTLIFQPRPDWHAAELRQIQIPDQVVPPPRYVLDEIHQCAVSLLEKDNSTYASSNMSADSSHKFLSTIMSSGTLEDKVSALTLLVQESPLHTTKAFENLLNLARKKSRNQALMALGALKDLLGSGVVLPPERKLRSFTKQPALLAAFAGKNSNWKQGQRLPPGLEEVHLIVWAYEDWLKKTYFEMLKVLEGWCNDEVEYSRSRSITFVYELLKEKPEQEDNLLRLLVNKLGDKEKKIASRASYLLLQLQISHPVMKTVVIGSIESELLFRPHQSQHAKYYAIITLNQTILSTKEQEVANKLMEIYFSLFVSLLKQSPRTDPANPYPPPNPNQGGGGKAGKKAMQKAQKLQKAQELAGKQETELADKLIAAILTGVNRAFPYAKTDDEAFEKQLDTIFRITHSSNFNTAMQALVLIQQISAAKHFSTDRFYRTLYESLLDPRLLTSSKQIMYLNLLYKSLKADVSIKRVKAFVKRLLQVITLHEPPFACSVLYLIYELTKVFPSIKTMLSTPEINDDDEEEHFFDAHSDTEEAAASDVPKPSKPAVSLHYDGRKRDPDHAHADLACLWEILPFATHFHPSVTLFATRFLYDQEMPPKPDPSSHTLMHFLDRFAYRNAKSKPTVGKGTSIMQPMAGATGVDLLIRNRDGARAEAPVNSEAFWRKKVEQVPADEVFFHKYFETSGKKAAADKKKRGKDKKGEDAEGSDAEEDEIWKALVGSRPEVEGPGDDESDDDLEALEDAMGDDEGDDDVDDDDGGVVIADAPDEDEDGEMGGSEDGEDLDLDSGDEAAFLGSDEELPSDFEGLPDGDDEEAGWEYEEEESAPNKKSKDEDEGDKRGKKKRKLKHLPTFASAEDYAKLLEDEDDY